LALRAYAVICGAIGVLPLANWLTGGRAVPWYGIAIVEWITRGLIVLGVATVLAILLGDHVEVLWGRIHGWLLAVPSSAFAFSVAAVAAVAAAGIAHWSFAGLPFTGDESSAKRRLDGRRCCGSPARWC
jgi:hypothetical protein